MVKEWKVLDFLLQRHWFTSVRKKDEQSIIALTDYMDNHIERRAGMEVEMSSLKIIGAWLTRLGRAGNMAEETVHVDSLKGVEAYLGSGRQMKAALQNAGDELERSLFNDCVIGVVQAETFFFDQRGYPDAEAYNDFWEKAYAGSCRYYSNLELVQSSWADFIGGSPRQADLFSRSKSQQLIKNQQGNQIIAGSLVDTFHQMASWLEFDAAGKVRGASGQVLRAPDQVCRLAADLTENLVGLSLSGKSKKEVAELMGAGQGCIHLIDLVWESIQTLKRHQGER